MKILITGHLGFVGTHMMAMLSRQGEHEITGLDIRSPGQWDVRDFFRTDDKQFDLVIHLAAVVGGRAKIDGAPLDLAVDLSIDAEMFGWALRTRPGKVVYFSSSAAYPVALQTRGYNRPLRETDIDLSLGSLIGLPDMTYGWAKLTGEMLAGHARNAGLDVLVVRPFSGYGPDQALDYPFPSFIKRAVERQDPFEIWGDPSSARDWIHIEDVCAATLAAVEQNIEGPINLGTGIPTTFSELALKVCEVAGYAPKIKHNEAAPQGVHTRVADAAKMLSFYTPQISLEDGIKEAIECWPKRGDV